MKNEEVVVCPHCNASKYFRKIEEQTIIKKTYISNFVRPEPNEIVVQWECGNCKKRFYLHELTKVQDKRRVMEMKENI